MKIGNCPGCLKTKQLVSSHLVSRAIYDYLRTDELHPIVAGNGEVRATTDQLQAELLCQECENMLNVGGEIWMVGKLCTVDRTFPLYDLLYQQAPIDTAADGDIFAAATNPAVAVQKICHFALGTFWKASLHPWKFGENIARAVWRRNSHVAPRRDCFSSKRSPQRDPFKTLRRADRDEPSVPDNRTAVPHLPIPCAWRSLPPKRR